MDNLKQYILMCRKAIEIQKLHKPAICDRYVCACDSCKDKPSIYYIHDYDMDHLNKRDLKNVEPHYASLVRSADVCSFVAYYHERCEEYLSYIWLPYQYQLQEIAKMLGTLFIGNGMNGVLVMHYKHLGREYTLKGMSMEQLWLGFVILERFGKTWNGKDWINNG